MADSLTITSTYSGELALPYIAPAILSANSIANNYVVLHEGVKKNAVMKKLAGSTIQSAGCDWNSSADMTLTEVILTPTELMVNEQFCKKEFRQDWEALQTGAGFINDQLPPNFQSYLLLFLANKVQEGIEKAIWHGNYNETDGSASGGGSVSTFDGLLHRIVDATPGYENLVAGAFTADANATTGILTHLDALVGNAPAVTQNDPNAVICMSRKSLFLLQRAMAGLVTTSGGFSPTFVGDPNPTTFLGFNIVTPAGMPNDTLVLSRLDNYHFGTDLTSDFNQAVVVDMTQTDGSDNVRVAMRFTGGVQIADETSIACVRRSS